MKYNAVCFIIATWCQPLQYRLYYNWRHISILPVLEIELIMCWTSAANDQNSAYQNHLKRSTFLAGTRGKTNKKTSRSRSGLQNYLRFDEFLKRVYMDWTVANSGNNMFVLIVSTCKYKNCFAYQHSLQLAWLFEVLIYWKHTLAYVYDNLVCVRYKRLCLLNQYNIYKCTALWYPCYCIAAVMFHCI